MKLKEDQKKLLESLIVLLGIFIFVIIIRNYFKPFLWIIIIFVLSSPLYNIFTKLKISKKISATLSLLFLNIIVFLFIYYLGRNIFELVNNIYISNINIMNKFLLDISEVLESIIGNINISGEAVKLLHPRVITAGAFNVGEGIISYFIGNICSFFILTDKDKLIGYMNRIIPRNLFKRINKGSHNIKSIISIQIILVLISTLIIIVGFIIFNIKNSFILGVICGILDLLPYVGTIIVFIPIIIYNIIVKDYLIAFGLICLYILVQVIREILEAKLLSNKFNVHPLIIFLSIYIGIKVFGILGIIIGPLYSMMVRDIFCED
ncbi:AI-2E family transporter [Eubacterium multiforme]|uniref:PurR-regulated permease PerM n=1 Tax=Eubacterium multiforme TaxID=83339 RepID=A0ABT9UQL2_9FIRM|nr:AI-2E family transporter [Eubacterium multiforme]MDQ0148944.1 putative PurR-regulated permease PerM [Eubacterium multiforme]